MKNVIEDQKACTITIDGVTVDGWRWGDGGICPACRQQGYYYQAYDAVFCAECNAWLESRCGDPACCYCARRPERPLPFEKSQDTAD